MDTKLKPSHGFHIVVIIIVLIILYYVYTINKKIDKAHYHHKYHHHQGQNVHHQDVMPQPAPTQYPIAY